MALAGWRTARRFARRPGILGCGVSPNSFRYPLSTNPSPTGPTDLDLVPSPVGGGKGPDTVIQPARQLCQSGNGMGPWNRFHGPLKAIEDSSGRTARPMVPESLLVTLEGVPIIDQLATQLRDAPGRQADLAGKPVGPLTQQHPFHQLPIPFGQLGKPRTGVERYNCYVRRVLLPRVHQIDHQLLQVRPARTAQIERRPARRHLVLNPERIMAAFGPCAPVPRPDGSANPASKDNAEFAGVFPLALGLNEAFPGKRFQIG